MKNASIEKYSPFRPEPKRQNKITVIIKELEAEGIDLSDTIDSIEKQQTPDVLVSTKKFFEHHNDDSLAYSSAMKVYDWYKDAILRRNREPLSQQTFFNRFFGEQSDNSTRMFGDQEKGYILGFFRNGIFFPTHFCPKSLRSGYELMKDLGSSSFPVIISVTLDLAETISKLSQWKVEDLEFNKQFRGQKVQKKLAHNNIANFEIFIATFLSSTEINREGMQNNKGRGKENILTETINAKNRPVSQIFDYSNQDKLKTVEEKIVDLTEYEKTFKKILERYGYGRLEIKKVGNNLFALPVDPKHRPPKLPENYGFKGGVVRATLLRQLGIDETAGYRDVDIEKISRVYTPILDEKIAWEHMSEDDILHNHGMSLMNKNYFETRDFTINEALYYDGKIYLTKECLLDTIRRIVRLSKNKQEKFSQKYAQDKSFNDSRLIPKALRMKAEEEALRGKKLELFDGEIYRCIYSHKFGIALHLDRAFQAGPEVAQKYIELLVEYDQLPKDYCEDPALLAILLNIETGFWFQYAPNSFFDKQANLYEDLIENQNKDEL